jgi:hypothetical protein
VGRGESEEKRGERERGEERERMKERTEETIVQS